MARAEGILRLLLVDDSLTEADAIINVLRSAGHAVRATREDNLPNVEQLVQNQTWDILICRDKVKYIQVSEVTTLVQRLGKDLPCIVLVSDKTNEEAYFDLNVQEVALFDDTRRIQFAVNRELKNLYARRLGRRNERALRESEKRSRSLLESSRDAVAYMHEGMHIYVNGAYLNLFGYQESEDVDGLPVLDLIVSEDHHKFKTIFRQFAEQPDADPVVLNASCVRADESQFKAKIEFSHARVEGEDCMQVVIRDEDEFVVEDAQAHEFRDHDLLTGLYTRIRFTDEFEKVAFNAVEGHGDADLLYIVLDEFQSIKEQVGLANSDSLIQNIADTLDSHRAEDEILARYSDQVFTVIIPNQNANEVEQRAASYLNAVSARSINANGNTLEVQCSIGIARITESQSTINTVLENADKACIQAQKSGGNQYARYQSELSVKSDELADKEWQNTLQQALKENSFSLQFQPIVNLHGEEQEFYEVLMRLKQSDGSVLKAEEFIEHAIQAQMMAEIDKWVIRTSLDRLEAHRKLHPKTRFFLKLSEQSLYVPGFVDWLDASLKAHSLPGNSVIFEISETAALANVESIKAVIHKLKQVGCEFGLEHFGSGIDFSNSLTMLDVDYLKINGTFVENMAQDPENQAAVKAIIEMTKQAGKKSIAEFVSDANSLALLWRLGVDYAQGYYIHEPSDQMDYDFDEEEDDL